jgi:hypothetical protein
MATEPAPSDNLSKETARATEDVRVLLEFLGRRADSLLQAQFEDTRGDRGASMQRLAVPPCRTYKHFLNRFTVIETKFHEPKPTQDTPSPTLVSPAEGDEDLSDLAFSVFEPRLSRRRCRSRHRRKHPRHQRLRCLPTALTLLEPLAPLQREKNKHFRG